MEQAPQLIRSLQLNLSSQEGKALSEANSTDISAATETILLYHATSRDAWEKIKASGGMLPSTNNYDWLGKGIYFWQAAPIRAWIWKRFYARPRLRAEDTVVLEYPMTVNPADCLDLLDIRWHKLLGHLGRAVPEGWRVSGIDEATIQQRLRRNRITSTPHPHFLDCEAINQICDVLEHRHKVRIRLVRAAFQHLDHIYPYSAFRQGDHVQVAVRDPDLVDVSKLTEVDGLRELEPRYAPGLTRGT